MTQPAVLARGTLQNTHLAFALLALLDKHATGTLVLETPGGCKTAIGFTNGVPKKFHSPERQRHLGDILVELGHLTAEQREVTQAAAAAAQRLHGEHLISIGAIDEDLLDRALRTQLLEQLSWACDLPKATAFGFYDQKNYLEHWAGAGTLISPLLVIWQLARAGHPLPQLAEHVQRWQPLVLKINPRAPLDAFGFDAAEQALVSTLRDCPQTMQSLGNLALVPETSLQRLIYVLALTRSLATATDADPIGAGLGLEAATNLLEPQKQPDSVSNSAAVVVHQEPSQVRAQMASIPGTDGQVEERRASLIALAEACEQMNHYELLNLEQQATAEQVAAAFFSAAKKFHPDRLGPDLADLRPLSAKLFARLTEAHQVLASDSARADYDRALAQGQEGSLDDEQQRINDILLAAKCYQKAEVLLKKRMLDAALLEARKAHESDPSQADYLALLAWVTACKTEHSQELQPVLIQLNTAVRMSPESEKVRFYRAQVLGRLGRQLEALSDYKFVVTKNPHNIDAQREVRLWEMRQKNQSTPAGRPSAGPTSAGNGKAGEPTRSGVLSKLFKR